MALQLNLQKVTNSAQGLRLCLQKAGIVTPPSMELGFGLDVSTSYVGAHMPGPDGSPSVTERLLERLVPWGMVFDPDKKLDVVTFSDGKENAVHVGALTVDNYGTFIEDHVVGCKGWRGGTDYSPMLVKFLQLFGFLATDQAEPRKGFFGRLFGGKQNSNEGTSNSPRKSLAIINTDGQNFDQSSTERVISESEERCDQTYFLFLGVNTNRREFAFVEHLAETYSNVGFYHVPDYEAFVEQSDDELNSVLLSPELLKWMAEPSDA